MIRPDLRPPPEWWAVLRALAAADVASAPDPAAAALEALRPLVASGAASRVLRTSLDPDAGPALRVEALLPWEGLPRDRRFVLVLPLHWLSPDSAAVAEVMSS